MEEWTEKEHLEYEEYLKEVKGYFSIDPCCKRDTCGNYVISMKWFLTHFKHVPSSELIEIASLNVGEMMELRDQLDEVITLECERDELERCLKIKDKK